MSKRFYYDEFCEEIFDEEIQTYPSNQSICGILNKQAERIAELEEQLKNAIVLPKYEKGQKIYWVSGKKILEGYFQCFNDDVWAEVLINPKEIIDEDGCTDVDFDVDMIWHKITFATKEEAQAKLKELKGE